ncbi:L-histidine N(alpha)-methyltransferase [Methylobacterium pseudosasicola]|uniref:Dimethylhistidine N-methyltransferase n=1 Tax=Methylobacterium pseudosasicola TaxID=582667 RepID=A0A1I4GR72_9HYPH|nr:L-histidine N(alpha)-methyltransferase [Methylobacterium pseudosasicola]SFL32409.1 dimethylhistidine N-methyltransferase [Methylobacterium pseudosasicola]
MSDPIDPRREFLRDALLGLTAEAKTLPGKYLWDETGSDLFDQICHNPDYYPTRQEMALLPRVAAELAARVRPGVTVVEFGSGASRKIRTLLDALPEPAAYVAIDISGAYLEDAIRRLAPDYPDIAMVPVCADYTKPVQLPVAAGPGGILGFYPGTSIGNFAPPEAALFLERVRATLGPSLFLVGADATVEPERLQRAYGGADGLMAAFHRNILVRLNRELGADFDIDNFRHVIELYPDPQRVEAHLVALRPATYRLGDQAIAFAAGERIRTDTSHKYAPSVFQSLASQSGWRPRTLWQAEEGDFNLHLLESTGG